MWKFECGDLHHSVLSIYAVIREYCYGILKSRMMYISCVSAWSLFYRLRPIARKTKVRVVISERYGLPFFLPHLQRRKAFLAGLVLTVMFWIISSMFVWDIQISGNCVITDDMIFQFLEQEGIQMGMRKSKRISENWKSRSAGSFHRSYGIPEGWWAPDYCWN